MCRLPPRPVRPRRAAGGRRRRGRVRGPSADPNPTVAAAPALVSGADAFIGLGSVHVTPAKEKYMFGRFRSRLTYANVVSSIALFAALGTGGPYAADTIGSSDVIDESLLSQDIKDGEVKTSDLRNSSVTSLKINNGSVLTSEIGANAVDRSKIRDGNVFTNDLADGAVSNSKLTDGAVTSAKVLDDNQVGGGLAAADLAIDSVGTSEIQTDGVGATEVQNDSIDSGEIVDFGLSNQDIGVLFAQVNADGTVFSSSGGVTATRISAGTYDVDFGRNIASCAFVATQGEGSVGGAPGGIMGVTDRSGNAEAVFATVRTNANALVDRAFQLLVVC